MQSSVGITCKVRTCLVEQPDICNLVTIVPVDHKIHLEAVRPQLLSGTLSCKNPVLILAVNSVPLIILHVNA